MSILAHVAVAARNGAGIDCWLSVSDLGDVLLSSGVLQECELLVLETTPTGDMALRASLGDGVVTFSAARGVTAEPESSAGARGRCAFRVEGVASTPGLFHFVVAGEPGARVCLHSDGASLVVGAGAPLEFALVTDPVLGAVTATSALRFLDGKAVALWSKAGDGAWVTAHPRGGLFDPFKVGPLEIAKWNVEHSKPRGVPAARCAERSEPGGQCVIQAGVVVATLVVFAGLIVWRTADLIDHFGALISR